MLVPGFQSSGHGEKLSLERSILHGHPMACHWVCLARGSDESVDDT